MQTLQDSFQNKILITGPPGCGKTTLIKNLYHKLKHLNPAGFYTEEIRKNGRRVGFRITTFKGDEDILAHVNIKSKFRVSKYGVNVEGFERILRGIDFFNPEHEIIMIDEIGKMECFSDYFRNLVLKLFESDKPFIATIAIRGNDFIERLKKKEMVKLYNIVKDKDKISDVIQKLSQGS